VTPEMMAERLAHDKSLIKEQLNRINKQIRFLKEEKYCTGKDMTMIKCTLVQRQSLKYKLEHFPNYKETEGFQRIERILGFYKVVMLSYKQFNLKPEQEFVYQNQEKDLIENIE